MRHSEEDGEYYHHRNDVCDDFDDYLQNDVRDDDAKAHLKGHTCGQCLPFNISPHYFYGLTVTFRWRVQILHSDSDTYSWTDSFSRGCYCS